MKTSNKILLGIISVIGLCMLSILIFGKSSLIHYDNNGVVGNGKIIKINHQIAEISFFRLSGQYEVYVKKGDPNLVVETDENIHSFIHPHDENYMIIENKGEEKKVFKELRIGRLDHINLQPSDGVKIYLTIPSLNKIHIGGTTKVHFDDNLTTDNFEAIIDDFAEAELNINVQNLKANVEGNARLEINGAIGETKIDAKDFSSLSIGTISGKKLDILSSGNTSITLNGKVDFSSIEANDFAKINAIDLNAKDSKIRAKGNADLTFTTNEKLTVEATDFATLKYAGNPTITENISSNASLNPIEN